MKLEIKKKNLISVISLGTDGVLIQCIDYCIRDYVKQFRINGIL